MSIVFQGERVRLIEGKYNRGEKLKYQLRYKDNNGVERRKMAPRKCDDVVAWAKDMDQYLEELKHWGEVVTKDRKKKAH